jgi:hypothetical protein
MNALKNAITRSIVMDDYILQNLACETILHGNGGPSLKEKG